MGRHSLVRIIVVGSAGLTFAGCTAADGDGGSVAGADVADPADWSAAQREALADSEVSDTEYADALDRAETCIAALGFETRRENQQLLPLQIIVVSWDETTSEDVVATRNRDVDVCLEQELQAIEDQFTLQILG